MGWEISVRGLHGANLACEQCSQWLPPECTGWWERWIEGATPFLGAAPTFATIGLVRAGRGAAEREHEGAVARVIRATVHARGVAFVRRSKRPRIPSPPRACKLATMVHAALVAPRLPACMPPCMVDRSWLAMAWRALDVSNFDRKKSDTRGPFMPYAGVTARRCVEPTTVA
jgi:hypothetical protein